MNKWTKITYTKIFFLMIRAALHDLFVFMTFYWWQRQLYFTHDNKKNSRINSLRLSVFILHQWESRDHIWKFLSRSYMNQLIESMIQLLLFRLMAMSFFTIMKSVCYTGTDTHTHIQSHLLKEKKTHINPAELVSWYYTIAFNLLSWKWLAVYFLSRFYFPNALKWRLIAVLSFKIEKEREREINNRIEKSVETANKIHGGVTHFSPTCRLIDCNYDVNNTINRWLTLFLFFFWSNLRIWNKLNWMMDNKKAK